MIVFGCNDQEFTKIIRSKEQWNDAVNSARELLLSTGCFMVTRIRPGIGTQSFSSVASRSTSSEKS